MVRIAVLDDYQNVALKVADWSALPPDAEVTVFSDHLSDRAAVIERLRDFEVVVAMRERTPFPAELLRKLPNLRLLVTTGNQNAAIDVEAAMAQGVTVCGTGSARYGTAELTWGLILALARQIPQEDRAVREGRWQTTLGMGLKGKTLGVIGLGNLGGQVARIGNAFGMRVVAWSQNLTAERAREAGATLVARDELLRDSDVVTIHLKLSERTRGLIGARELALMKQTAYIVNTSRGPIIDEPGLVDALERGVIGGAGLDTFDVEPLPAGHAFRGLRNVVLTPHVGYVIDEGYEQYYGDAVENIAAFLRGAPVRVIHEGAGYAPGIV
jgi:phosphoglycerate dehydrogenase-like enzyme